MSDKPYLTLVRSPGIIIPKHIIKEQLDEVARTNWNDPGRFQKKKKAALRYIPVRAKELRDVEKLIREVKRVFHDDLLNDPDIREAVERAVHRSHLELVPAAPVEEEDDGKVFRGLDNLTDEKLLDLEWQHEEDKK